MKLVLRVNVHEMCYNISVVILAISLTDGTGCLLYLLCHTGTLALGLIL